MRSCFRVKRAKRVGDVASISLARVESRGSIRSPGEVERNPQRFPSAIPSKEGMLISREGRGGHSGLDRSILSSPVITLETGRCQGRA